MLYKLYGSKQDYLLKEQLLSSSHMRVECTRITCSIIPIATVIINNCHFSGWHSNTVVGTDASYLWDPNVEFVHSSLVIGGFPPTVHKHAKVN